jgi:hypothetical protein
LDIVLIPCPVNHIGNLVLENTNAPISGNERPTSVQVPSMFQTTINYTMSEYNTNEIQATAIYNYKREALALEQGMSLNAEVLNIGA